MEGMTDEDKIHWQENQETFTWAEASHMRYLNI